METVKTFAMDIHNRKIHCYPTRADAFQRIALQYATISEGHGRLTDLYE
jgi:hypothetical protein